MINVCTNCGEYRADKIIDPTGSFAICPVCNQPHPFQQLPIFFVCGASGTGKTTIANHLTQQTNEVIILDGDILWRPEFNTPENNYRDFFETWLRLSKNIAQSGHPVVIFNAGSIPENIEPCIERRYFSHVHYLALVCDLAILNGRLQARPTWRESNDSTFISEQIKFNTWLKEQAQNDFAQIELLDTSTDTAVTTAQKVREWLQQKMR